MRVRLLELALESQSSSLNREHCKKLRIPQESVGCRIEHVQGRNLRPSRNTSRHILLFRSCLANVGIWCGCFPRSYSPTHSSRPWRRLYIESRSRDREEQAMLSCLSAFHQSPSTGLDEIGLGNQSLSGVWKLRGMN